MVLGIVLDTVLDTVYSASIGMVLSIGADKSDLFFYIVFAYKLQVPGIIL